MLIFQLSFIIMKTNYRNPLETTIEFALSINSRGLEKSDKLLRMALFYRKFLSSFLLILTQIKPKLKRLL